MAQSRTEQTASAIGPSTVLNRRYLPPPEDGDGKLWVRTSALIQSTCEQLYALWRDVEYAPAWREQVTSVNKTGERTSHWTIQHGEKTIEWNSEILADEPCRRIAWRSTGGDLVEAGEVIFESAAGDRGSIVTVLQEFRMGKFESAWQSVTGRNPKQGVIESVRHLKALAETGEIPRIAGQPHGKRGTVAKTKKSVYGETIATPPGTKKSGTGGVL